MRPSLFGMMPIIETRLTSLICLRIYSTFVLVGFSTINQGCTNCGILASWLRENGKRMRKWSKNGEKMSKWIENEEMERKWGNFPHSLSISYIKNCRKMLKTALLLPMTQKTQHTRYEKILLVRIRCEKARKLCRPAVYIHNCRLPKSKAAPIWPWAENLTWARTGRMSGSVHSLLQAQLPLDAVINYL